MPKAEVGSTKYLNNKLKSKGLQRLRWYCQVCERQMRDENGFKMHTQSESHVRQMLLVGEDPRKHINDYSSQFQRDFLLLLRTSHGEKKVHMNHFYQEYIHNKEHVHMNATKWPSLTEFAKFLGREGICRVEDDEKGLHIAWIDNSPENLRRQDAIRRKERQDKGDETREQMLIREQVRRAQQVIEAKVGTEEDETEGELKREEGEKIKLSLGTKQSVSKSETLQAHKLSSEPKRDADLSSAILPAPLETIDNGNEAKADQLYNAPTAESVAAPSIFSVKMGSSTKPKNVFAAAKKNHLGGKKTIVIEQPHKVSEAERIMNEEIERKKNRRPSKAPGGPPLKRQRL